MTILSIKAEKINTKVVKTTSNNYIHFLIPSSFIKAVRTEKVDVSSFNLLGLSKDVRIESSLDVNLYNKASDLLTVTTTKEGVNKKGEEIGEIKLSLNSIIYIVETNNGVEVCVLLPNGSRTSIVSYIISETIEELITQIESDLIGSGGGGIQSIQEGTNITVDNTDPENPIISATDNASALFPNGYEFISESRDFLSTDEGKLLILETGVTISMPSEFPFLSNQILGVFPLDSNCYYQDKSGSSVQIFGINNQPNEVVVLLSEPDFNSLIPISSPVIEGKTMLKYLYDKSQNAIQLSGTEVGNPVTGNIQIKNNQAVYSYGSDNISYGSFGVEDDRLLIKYESANNSSIRLDENGIIIDANNPLSKGLTSSLDFSTNLTDLAYTQKIYVDKIAGYRGTATLSSGTVTVATDKIKTGYKIYLSVNTPSGTQGFLSAPTGSIVDETEFVINSTSATDDSTVNWWIAP